MVFCCNSPSTLKQLAYSRACLDESLSFPTPLDINIVNLVLYKLVLSHLTL